jgi:hypothetical protein
MNRECYPASLFPLRGDLFAEAGSTTVEVIGLQNIPIAPNPRIDKYVPTYVAANGDIEWMLGSGGEADAIEVNSDPVSQDALVLVNNNFVFAGGALGIAVNGTRIV